MTWNNGDPLTADDVIFNLQRWCERDVEGNSMAARFATLIDKDSGKLADGIVEPVDWNVGSNAWVVRRKDGKWWGCEACLDGVDFIDYGTDPSAEIAAFESGEIDLNHESITEFIEIPDTRDLVRSEAVNSATVCARTNVANAPYDDKRVRQA